MRYSFSILLFIALFGLTACNPKFDSDKSKWILFGNQNSDKLYYTFDKLDKNDNGVIKIWVKTVFAKKISINDIDAIYAKNMFMINCSANSYKENVGFYFSASDEIISKTQASQPEAPPLILDRSSREFTFKPISTAHEIYFPILPGSPVESLKVIACKQKI